MTMSLKSCVSMSAAAAVIGAVALLTCSKAKAFPVDSPKSFQNYLNNNSDWRDGYKVNFNTISECYKNYKKNGKIKSYVCKNGEAKKTSPKGEKSTCKVDLVKITRKGKLKLITLSC